MGKQEQKESGEKEEMAVAMIGFPTKMKVVTVTGSAAKSEHKENKEPVDPPKSLIVKVSTHIVLTMYLQFLQCPHNCVLQIKPGMAKVHKCKMKLYTCNKCKTQFLSKSAFEFHISSCINDVFNTCEICTFKTPTCTFSMAT